MIVLGAALVIAAVSVALAAIATARSRAVAEDRADLRAEVGALVQRLEAAEKTASDAQARAAASLNLLLDKGVADEEDVAAARGADDDGERGPDTVH